MLEGSERLADISGSGALRPEAIVCFPLRNAIPCASSLAETVIDPSTGSSSYRKAAAHSEDFSWNASAAKYIALYRKISEARGFPQRSRCLGIWSKRILACKR
jgi:hypothetical protein